MTVYPAGLASAQTPATPPAPGSALPPARDPLYGRIISKVEVEGNVRTDSNTILSQVRAQPGQRYDPALLDIDVRSIAALERFVTVRADVIPTDRGEVVIRFDVTERNTVADVELFGNHKLTDDKLRPELIEHRNGAIDDFSIKTDLRTIEQMYVKLGYNFVHVSVDENLLKTKGIVRYTIVEGPKVRVRVVKFTGNNAFSNAGLRWKIKTKRKFWILRTGRLDQENLDGDTATIRDKYVSKGYLDARVSVDLQFSDDKRWVTVRFIIAEGPHYKIGSVLIKGNTVFQTNTLKDAVGLAPGDYFDRDRIDASEKRIADRYGHAGYIYSNVVTTPTYSEPLGTGVADLTFNISEGKSYDVGRVIVRGNPEIQDRVIRRQIRIYPDQVYDKVLVQKSIDRLKGTGLFEDMKIDPIGNEQTTRDALVQVAEGKTAKLLFGAGISSNTGLLGQVSVEQNNFDIANPPHSWGEFFSGQSFKGAGQYFRLLLEPGTDVQRYRVTFREPYLFDSDYSFSNDAYFFTRSRESYDESRLGDQVTLGRRFGDIYSAGLTFRGENVRISKVQDSGIQGLNDTIYDSAQEILNNQGDHLITSIRPSVIRDTTDSQIFPTVGSRATLGLEQYGAFGGDYTFTKIDGSFDIFHTVYSDPFDRKTVIRSSTSVGLIPAGNSVFFERYYGGGVGSLRGFKFRGVSPRSGLRNDPVGGDFSFDETIEINHPLFEDLVRGVAFIDVGDVEPDIRISTIRADIGVGIRLNLPIFSQVPLALDFAYPIAKAQNDETRFVSFSLGLPF